VTRSSAVPLRRKVLLGVGLCSAAVPAIHRRRRCGFLPSDPFPVLSLASLRSSLLLLFYNALVYKS
jgi:hypothetical protein